MSSLVWGSVAEWFSGFASVLTIFLTIRYYNKDNLPKIYTRILDGFKKNDGNGGELSSSGYTLEIINAGKSPTRVKFEGLISNYTIWEKLQRWILRKLSRCSIKALDSYRLSTHSPQVSLIEYFDKTDYDLIDPFQDPVSIAMTIEQVEDMIKSCVENSSYQQKKMIKNKDLKFHFLICNFVGKEYKNSIILKSNEELYITLKEDLQN